MRQQLWAKAWDLPMREAQLPDKWHGTKRAFEEMKEDYISYKQELSAALASHRQGEKSVIPIRIRQCLWDKLEISKIQGLPAQWMASPKDDAAWTEIAHGVEKAIQALQKKKQREARGRPLP